MTEPLKSLDDLKTLQQENRNQAPKLLQPRKFQSGTESPQSSRLVEPKLVSDAEATFAHVKSIHDAVNQAFLSHRQKAEVYVNDCKFFMTNLHRILHDTSRYTDTAD